MSLTIFAPLQCFLCFFVPLPMLWNHRLLVRYFSASKQKFSAINSFTFYLSICKSVIQIFFASSIAQFPQFHSVFVCYPNAISTLLSNTLWSGPALSWWGLRTPQFSRKYSFELIYEALSEYKQERFYCFLQFVEDEDFAFGCSSL